MSVLKKRVDRLEASATLPSEPLNHYVIGADTPLPADFKPGDNIYRLIWGRSDQIKDVAESRGARLMNALERRISKLEAERPKEGPSRTRIIFGETTPEPGDLRPCDLVYRIVFGRSDQDKDSLNSEMRAEVSR